MELNKTKLVEIGDLKFYIRFSNKAFLTHINKSKSAPDSMDLIVYYFYDLAKLGAKDEGVEFNYSFDEFYEAIDCYSDAFMVMDESISSLFPEDKKKLKEK
jgi:hypothetical protein